jgi:hypothetical protein
VPCEKLLLIFGEVCFDLSIDLEKIYINYQYAPIGWQAHGFNPTLKSSS